MNHFRTLSLILLLSITACGKSENERNLERKEKELRVREKELNTREKQIGLKELHLNRRQQQLDSLRGRTDTISVYNAELEGTWTVTMNCIETNCEGSAIGDTKTEQWIISYQNEKVVAQAMANKKLIRVYRGLYKENTLTLSAAETPGQEVHMNVILTPHTTTKGLMEGQRAISRVGNCRTVYTLKAEKQ